MRAFARLAQSSEPAKARLTRGSKLARGSPSPVSPLVIDAEDGIAATVMGSGGESYRVVVRFAKLSDRQLSEISSQMAARNGPDAPDADANYLLSLALPKAWAFFRFECDCVDARGTGGAGRQRAQHAQQQSGSSSNTV